MSSPGTAEANRTCCLGCGNPHEASLTEGLCARCLLASALEAEQGADDAVDAATGGGSGAAMLPASRIGRYELREEIDRGGVGVVYRAWQADLKREVALKMLLPARLETPEALSRFRREAELMASLDHPAILPVYEVGDEDGRPFYSMKLAEGGNLATRIAALRGKYRESARLVAAIARGIGSAHEHGVLHRDLKPSNIVFDASGQCMVTDFGLARLLAVDSSLTGSDALIGTPRYVAPEMVTTSGARLTEAADVYGLGAILYELLTGSAPFAELAPLQILQQIAVRRPWAPRKFDKAIPRLLEAICLRCLEKRPGDRYRSAVALAQALEDWLQDRGGAKQRWISAVARGLPSRRRRFGWWLAAATLPCAFSAAWLIGHRVELAEPDPAVATRTLAVIPAGGPNATATELAAVRTLSARLQGTQPLTVLPADTVLVRTAQPDFPRDEEARGAALAAFVNVIVAARDGPREPELIVRVKDVVRFEALWTGRMPASRLDTGAAEIAGVLNARRARPTPESAVSRDAVAELMRGDRLLTQYTATSNDEAVKAYRHASELAPGWAVAHAMLAQAYSERANRFADAAFWTDAALEESERAIRLDPTLAGAYGVLGQAYYNKGWWQRSTEAYERGIALGGGRSGMGLSINYYLSGRLDESYAIHHTQLELDPDDFFMGYLAAQVLFAAGSVDAGERQMRQAIARIQPEKQREAEAEIALFRGDYARCRELTNGLDPFLKSGGSFSASVVARACAVRQRDYVGALALLQPDLERSSSGKGDLLGNANPVLEQAILLGLLEQHKEARPLLESARHTAQVAIDSGNENWKNWLRVAAVERSSGKEEEAYRALGEAFAHGMTINARTDGDLEFLPFRDDVRFAQLRDNSRAKVAAMRERIEKMLQDPDHNPASADLAPPGL